MRQSLSICLIEAFFFSSMLGLIGIYKKSYKILLAALLCFAVIASDDFLNQLPKIFNFSYFHWNWEGKLLELPGLVLLIYLLKRKMPNDYFCYNFKWKQVHYGVIIGLIYTVFALIEMYISASFPPNSLLNIETILFQFTLPGITEEILFRGILLAITNQVLGYRWKIGQIKFGIGAILITLLFIFGHIFDFKTMSFSIENLTIDLVFLSVMLILLREKTGSIWPGVFLHNIANGLQFSLVWLFKNLLA